MDRTPYIPTPKQFLFDIVSVDHHGQRVHEPVARIAAPSAEDALRVYRENPSVYLHKDSGIEVDGCSLAAYSSHPRLCGPYANPRLRVRYENLTLAIEELNLCGVNSWPGMLLGPQDWVVAWRQASA